MSSDPRERVDDELFDGLVRAYAEIRGSVTTSIASAPRARVALLAQTGVEPPTLLGDSQAWCAVVGRPYPSASLLDSDIRELDGQFALVEYDGRADEVRIATDAFGFQALYLAVRGSAVYVSTSALALAKLLRAAPNRFALEFFLRSGYQFGTLTNWEGIERLEPATCVKVGPGWIERDVYWRPAVDRSVAAMTLREAVDHCVRISVSEFGHRYAGRGTVWTDLTGGFDSRLLALLLERADVAFECNTRGPDDDADRTIAAEIARVKNWPLFAPVLPDSWGNDLPDLLPQALAWGDSHLDVLELAWVLWVHRELGAHYPTLLSGGGGEHWRDAAWKQEFFQAGRTTTVNMRNLIDMRMLFPLDVSVFARDPTPAVRDDLRRRMSAWAEPYSDELNTFQLDIMYAYKMTGHFGAYRSADAAHLVAELPFYSKNAFTAAISVDHRHRARHRLVRRSTTLLDPTVASIGTTGGGPAVPLHVRTAHRFLPYYARLGRRAITKVSQAAFGRSLLAPRPRGWWAPTSARRAVIDILGRDSAERRTLMRSHTLYDANELERFFEANRAGERAGAELLSRIVTVELALREVDAGLE